MLSKKPRLVVERAFIPSHGYHLMLEANCGRLVANTPVSLPSEALLHLALDWRKALGSRIPLFLAEEYDGPQVRLDLKLVRKLISTGSKEE